MRKIFLFLFILSGFISWGQNPAITDIRNLYNSHNYKSVIETARPLLENEPASIELNLMVGRSFADLKDFQKAIPYLETTVKNDTGNTWCKAWALNYLGTCNFMLQKYEESEKYFKECIQLNATKNVTNEAYSGTLLFGFNDFYKNWKIVETSHFRFHFQNMEDADIEKYTAAREKAYKDIDAFFKCSLPKKIDFFVWQSNEDARTILKGNVGFAKPDFCVVHTLYKQTIGHEMTHVISNYTSPISNKTRLINEGTAVCFDQSNNDRLKMVKQWITDNNKQIAVKAIWNNEVQQADEVLYPLAGLFVKELIDNFGKEKFLEFFKIQTYDNARLVFGDKLDKVIQDFENKINT